MLVSEDGGTATRARPAPSGEANATTEVARKRFDAEKTQRLLGRGLPIEWSAQMIASICWIASVVAYGLSSTGDWLQLCAASAWLLANIASLKTSETE